MKIQDFQFGPEQQEVAEKFILSAGDDPSIVSFLTQFRKLYEKETTKDHLVGVKNIMAQKLICDQMKVNGGWFHVGPIWGEKETCRSCSGLGEIYKFRKAPQEHKCSCDNGFVWIPCNRCDAGMFTKRNGEKVPCKNCTPPTEQYDLMPEVWDANKGRIRKRCKNCLGNAKVKTLPKLLPEIQSTTPCKTCKGLGWVSFTKPTPAVKQPIFNDGLKNQLEKLL